MKNRFSTVDILASIGELKKSCLGSIISTIYDLNPKTYLFKLKRHEETTMMLIESGCRIHSTDYNWPKNQFPSMVTMKLRKHLRNRRLHGVKQLGVDRIVQLTVGTGDRVNHVFIELFDRGNIILCDHDYVIILALRWRRDDHNNIICGTGLKYNADGYRTLQVMSVDAISKSVKDSETVSRFIMNNLFVGNSFVKGLLKKDVINQKSTEIAPEELFNYIEHFKSYLDIASNGQCKGYISYDLEANIKNESFERYSDFFAFDFENLRHKPLKEFNSFSKAIDEFFSRICQQKIDAETIQNEKAALKKISNVEADIENRCRQLQQEQEDCARKAELIRLNIENVESAIFVVRNALANGLSWNEIEEMVAEGKRNKNPVAQCIEKLQLEKGSIVLKLQDDVEGSGNVGVDVSKGAYANVESYYDTKKALKQKEERTRAASSKALKAANRKKNALIRQAGKPIHVEKNRKSYWFQKFIWFISSDNYLVIAGRDQQENEVIVKKYMDPNDIYVHSENHGSSSVIIKNPTGGPVPPRTISEAIQMAVCYSPSWEAKVLTSAYWVHAHQVSKTAQAGEYLGTGSFMIRGKRNIMRPDSLVYGCGLLFKIDEDSLANHVDERKAKFGDNDDQSPERPAQTKGIFTISEGQVEEKETYIIFGGVQKIKPQKEQRKGAKKRGGKKEEKKIPVVIGGSQKRRKGKKGKRNESFSEDDGKSKISHIQTAVNVLIEMMAEQSFHKNQEPLKSVNEQKEEPNLTTTETINEDIKEISSGDDNDENDGEEEDLSRLLSSLTGIPKESDELLFCIPVYAPYSSLLSYKYRAKLQPGQYKRGKAGKSIMNGFISDKNTPPTQKALIKAIKEQEVYRNMPGSVKVSNIRIN